MKRTLIFLIAISVLASCNQHNSNQKTEKSNQQLTTKKDTSEAFRKLLEKEEKLKTLKDIDEYKLAFLEGRIDKALRLLGQSDDEMISPTGRRGAYIWYDKVKKNNEVRHLVIEFGTDGSEQIALQVLPVVDSSYFYSTHMDKVFVKKP
ncbi:hypothetical protein [Pedobacter sp. UBA4863]|uniref:hypothetical protein n=1 Tax=Pedobacter sp. UBA4863 TaxID=1947060 RepID=UPI0025DDE2E1|nr:hypothetical protein [Pedobacter sp. UBA4863]